MTKYIYMNILRRGFQTCGKSMDAYYYVEEELRCDEAEIVFQFTKWIVENDLPVGPDNVSERCKEFKKYIKENPPVVEEKEETPDGKLEIAPGVFVEVMTLG
jgi:hypothetical protein